jgi:hypothetical protein
VGVEFSSFIVRVKAKNGVFDETDDLDIRRSFCPLEASNSIRRNETCAVVRLGAVCYDLGFYVSNGPVRVRRAP